MKKEFYFYSLLFQFIYSIGFSQNSFEINNLSKQYRVNVSVEEIEKNRCSGKGSISIYLKENNTHFQTLNSSDLIFYTEEKNHNKIKNPTLKDTRQEELPAIFDDYNFDGYEDVAVRNGNNGNYGGPSYDIYVFNITKKRFVLSKELTKLATENLGLIELDKDRKRIITYLKSGCCWHSKSEYEVVFGKGLQLVLEIIEHIPVDDTDHRVVTEKKLIDGKWVVKKKKYRNKI